MMSKIVGDHRRLLVKRTHLNPDGSGICSYLCGISSHDFSINYEYVELPSICGGIGNSCGGLIFLWNGDGEGVILNPLSSEELKRKILPPSTVSRPESTSYIICKAAGIGYDSRNDEYKVIRFMDFFYEGYEGERELCPELLGSHIELYSIQNNHWKMISTPEILDESVSGIYVCPKAVCVNNKCYWLTAKLDAGMPSAVVSFDFENESFSSLLSFPVVKGGRADCYGVEIVEYKGYLALIVFEVSGPNKGFEVWVLKDEYELPPKWEKVFNAWLGGAFSPLGFGRNWEVMFFEGDAVKKKNGDITRQLLFADLTTETKELKALPNFEYRFKGGMEMFSYSCVETRDRLPDVVAEKLTREALPVVDDEDLIEEGPPGVKKVGLVVYSDIESKV